MRRFDCEGSIPGKERGKEIQERRKEGGEDRVGNARIRK